MSLTQFITKEKQKQIQQKCKKTPIEHFFEGESTLRILLHKIKKEKKKKWFSSYTVWWYLQQECFFVCSVNINAVT